MKLSGFCKQMLLIFAIITVWFNEVFILLKQNKPLKEELFLIYGKDLLNLYNIPSCELEHFFPVSIHSLQ